MNANYLKVKEMFKRTHIELALIAVILAGVAIFQFVHAQGDDDGDTQTRASIEAQERQPASAGGFAGGEIPGITPNINNAARAIDARTTQFGADDYNFMIAITVRFIINVLFAYILICVIFSKAWRLKEHSFTYFVSNVLIFMVTSLLASVRVRQGFAFGLFAILSILRFRTEQLQVREMTFLFAALIMGVINSLATDGLSIIAIVWANVILCVSIYICDGFFMGSNNQINLIYDNTKLLAKGKRKELFEDIKNRFGYDVVNVVILKMDYLTDSAEVKLVYKKERDAPSVS